MRYFFTLFLLAIVAACTVLVHHPLAWWACGCFGAWIILGVVVGEFGDSSPKSKP